MSNSEDSEDTSVRVDPVALWRRVEETLSTATSMHFDGCHKIYISMDTETCGHLIELGYETWPPDVSMAKHWFEVESCSLRFIQTVRHIAGDLDHPRCFTNLIAQFELLD